MVKRVLELKENSSDVISLILSVFISLMVSIVDLGGYWIKDCYLSLLFVYRISFSDSLWWKKVMYCNLLSLDINLFFQYILEHVDCN